MTDRNGPDVVGRAGRGREFFTTRTVAEALAGFRPERRTAAETVALADALHRVPVAPVAAPHALPGFARSTVDGYAVRAADTYGVSDGLPGYLDVTGAVRMGAVPDVAVGPGTAVSMPTGGVLPPGADAVVMIEYTQAVLDGTIEVVRPVAPGDGVVRADEDAAAGAGLVPAGRPLRAQDLGMLAAAGVTCVAVHACPRVTIFSTGDEVVPPDTATLRPGQVRDASAVALAAMITQAGGQPRPGGIVPDDPAALDAALRAALVTSDVIVISAGSSVGARDETAAAVARLGPPGIWCHGLAIRPGKPTLLAECAGVPIIGLPGNPRSALVVFRLVGVPLVRQVGGCTTPPAEPVVLARLERDLASSAGRLDVVQVRVRDGVAAPVFGLSALLSVLTAADGYVVVPEEATGLDAGAQVEVTLYR
ncbi:MAG TPA: gephyrin-like molybdotransferase Glp [Streptosporangiaceae bacterium]|jgi:molybdopterin molybdotransferase|nr:gephyrin-like molybdotransferase Glp [Streptosporangiaceae bacterium]